MSSIAVFMVLGGSAYAAATLPKNEPFHVAVFC
jgi:hypothetical protein